MKKLILLALVILGFTVTSFAQNLIANAGVFAIVQSSTGGNGAYSGAGIGSLHDMNFGSINVATLTSGVGSVTIDPSTLSPNTTDLTVQAVYNNVAVGSNSATVIPASFSVTGLPTSIMITSSATLKSGTNTMIVNDIKSNKNLITSAAGTKTLYVGGTLNLAANQAVGGYASFGDIVVTIAY
jgi:hypothetical protein